jgi:hypothetical protein
MSNGINIYEAIPLFDLIDKNRRADAYDLFVHKMQPHRGHTPVSSRLYKTFREEALDPQSDLGDDEYDTDDELAAVLRRGTPISQWNSGTDESVRQLKLVDFLHENKLRHKEWINSVHLSTKSGFRLVLGPLEIMHCGRRTVAVAPKRRESCALFNRKGGLTTEGYVLSAAWHLGIYEGDGRVKSGRQLKFETLPRRTLLLEVSRAAAREGSFPKAAYVPDDLGLFFANEVRRLRNGIAALDSYHTRYRQEYEPIVATSSSGSRLDARQVPQYELFVDAKKKS